MADSGFDVKAVRVKLDLSCAIPRRNEHNLVWIVVDRSTTATIKQFAKLIRTKYGVDKRNELYLEDAWLPPEEPIQILRDRDLVRIVASVKKPSNSTDNSENSSEPTLADEGVATSSKKSKKRKRAPSGSNVTPIGDPTSDTVNAFQRSPAAPAPSASTPTHDAATHLHPTAVWPETPKEPTINSTPLQVSGLPTTPLPVPHTPSSTPDAANATGPQEGSAKKKARRPRRKKKKPNELAVGPVQPLPPAVLPVFNAPHPTQQTELPAKHLRFDEHSSSDEDGGSVLQQSMLAECVEAVPRAPSTTQSPVKVAQEKELPLTNGQAVWRPCAAGSYTAVPPPSQTVASKAELRESYEEASEAASPEESADIQPKGAEKSYSAYPPLKTPPRVGDLIAFKVLELDSNYCPNVSDYKEGKVLSHNSVSDMVRIELSNAEAKPTYGGKFELEAPEEGLPPMEKVVELMWTELLEPVIMS